MNSPRNMVARKMRTYFEWERTATVLYVFSSELVDLEGTRGIAFKTDTFNPLHFRERAGERWHHELMLSGSWRRFNLLTSDHGKSTGRSNESPFRKKIHIGGSTAHEHCPFEKVLVYFLRQRTALPPDLRSQEQQERVISRVLPWCVSPRRVAIPWHNTY